MTTPETLAHLPNAPFDFVQQPDPVPAALRPERRVPLLLLLVARSHGAGASWKGIHLLNWMVASRKHAELILALRNGRDLPDRAVVRFEPALDRALDIAVGIGLLEQKSTRVFRLTHAGSRLVDDINSSGAFRNERELLNLLGGKLTQKEVRFLLEWRTS